ncbi:chromate efflux transporter [Aliiglaciecola sp. CAU 1673]|uniref:chromate efflux transporter n=1 Tax=Aliiglaciecola sp. CAU 1673 TaxID=3032595 RepID=UPI0023DCBEA6|nr:chromate efflux transporter [Aliiglaciecola sp. CAU 1673]MDF2177076.1 chromate efflux transporter [Aliiglaciecola sp. CAU 1673]
MFFLMDGSLQSFLSIFGIFLRLGLTSFGGPVAHIGYFHQALVIERRWLDDQRFAELLALCQFMPGPASSQLGFAIGLEKGGLSGGLAAWLGFTLPSALLMLIFAWLSLSIDAFAENGLHGLVVAAVAVVTLAVWQMGQKLCETWPKRGIALLSALLMLNLAGLYAQIAVILIGAVLGGLWLKPAASTARVGQSGVNPVPPGTAKVAAALFAALLLFSLAPLGATWPLVAQLADLYRSGALVFGGGHVVLPLLESEFVQSARLSEQSFMTGYGAAQALPGPLFSFAAYLGAMSSVLPGGFLGALLGGLCALLAIFLPGLLLVIVAMPLWQRLQHHKGLNGILAGVNAAVVGLLGAALYDPLWLHGILGWSDVLLALAAFLALLSKKVPVVWVVLITGVIPLAFGQ